ALSWPGVRPEQMRPLSAPPKSAMAKPQGVAPVLMSKLLSNYAESHEDGCEDYPTLSDYVQDFLNHLTELPGGFEAEMAQFAETLNGWVTADDALQELQATSIPNFCIWELAWVITSQSGNFHQLLCQRGRTEYEIKDQAAKGDEVTRKRFHAFVLFLGELYLNLEIKGTNGQVTRADILQVGLQELLNALFSNPMEDNLTCVVKLLKLTGSRIENVVLDANCSRDVKQMLLKLVELRASNWGRVHATSTYREATPKNDPDYFMNEPTFYTSDVSLSLRLIQITKRNTKRPGDPYLDDIDDEMDPEIEEVYEKFCLESERKQKQ
uniref:Polyadenylate-binding protein-interacting protein 1 n=1 Tax=Jaculus jaculus TaxID=51337 RepID=A0A8C5LGN0_JACJA